MSDFFSLEHSEQIPFRNIATAKINEGGKKKNPWQTLIIILHVIKMFFLQVNWAVNYSENPTNKINLNGSGVWL